MTVEELQKTVLDLQNEMKELKTNNQALTEQNKKLTEKNSSLLEANSEMFMRIQTQNEEDDKPSKHKDKDIPEINSKQEFEEKQIEAIIALMHPQEKGE